MTQHLKVGLIVPCYNEENRLQTESFLHSLEVYPNLEFIFVNDGSRDNTLDVLQNLASENERIHVVNLEKNCGKAEAIRACALKLDTSQYDLIGYWDADLATPLSELEGMVDVFEKRENVVYCQGVRLLRMGAPIKRKTSRHYLGRVFATIVSSMLKLPVYDSQCGAKIFKSDVVQVAFSQAFISKWFFDVEILFRLKNHLNIDLKNPPIFELPLQNWEDIKGSKLKLYDFLMAPWELFKIWRHYKR